MFFLPKIFNKGSNDYVYLREAFENHHHEISEELNKNHPHAVGILARYGVDLKKLRKRAATVVAAAAVAGLLLVRPHGLADPSLQKTDNPSSETVASQEHNAPTSQLVQKHASGAVLVNAGGSENSGGSDNDGTKGKGHRGHTRGRSYLAPPKEHGLHDLGLHKGDKNAPHEIKNVDKDGDSA